MNAHFNVYEWFNITVNNFTSLMVSALAIDTMKDYYRCSLQKSKKIALWKKTNTNAYFLNSTSYSP